MLNFVIETCNQCPETTRRDYVAKNWALAMMLKALPLVHFWSVLLLKEQMMTSVRKTLNQRKTDRFLAKFALENNHKIGRYLPISLLFGKVCPENSREIHGKSADFSAKNTGEI